MLPSEFYTQLYDAVNVLVHPVAFTQINQKSFHYSEMNGKPSSPAGAAGRLDDLIFDASTSGLPQMLKVQREGRFCFSLCALASCRQVSAFLNVLIRLFFNAGKVEKIREGVAERL